MKHLFKISLLLISCIFFIMPVNAKTKTTIFAQITDLHFNGNQESVDNYAKLIKSINDDKQLQFVVFTGDNINKSRLELLKLFLKMTKKLNVPYYIQVGNEESSKSSDLTKKIYLKNVNFNTMRYEKSFNYVVKKGGVIFILVDGSREVLPAGNGYYKESTIQWLDKKLTKYKDKNVIIMQHYPIYDIAENSLQNLYKPELYRDLLEKHKNVKAIFAGHYHTNREELINDVLYVTTDSAQTGKSMYRKVFLIPEGNRNLEIYSQIVKF